MKIKDLESKTISMLKALASKMGISLRAKRKADIISEIIRASKAAVRRPPGPQEGAPAVHVPPKSELLKLTVARLRSVAEGLGLKLRAKTKAEMVSELSKGVRALKAHPKKVKPAAKKKTAAPRKGKAGDRRTKKAPAPTVAVKVETVTLRPVTDLIEERKKEKEAPPALPGRARPLIESAIGIKKPVQRPRDEAVQEAPALVTRPAEAAPSTPAAFDWITAVAVDTKTIFVAWEMTDEAYSKGRPTLKITDVTEAGPEGLVAARCLYLPIRERAGEAFVEADPGRQYSVEAGVLLPDGGFAPAASSGRAATPPAAPEGGESVLPDEHFRIGLEGLGSP